MRNRKLEITDIVTVLQAFDAGQPAHEVCATWGVSQATLYEWRRLYGGIPLEAAQRLARLMRENAELKRHNTILELDCQLMQALLHQQHHGTEQRCHQVSMLLNQFKVSLARACRVVGISRTLFIYRSTHDDAT